MKTHQKTLLALVAALSVTTVTAHEISVPHEGGPAHASKEHSAPRSISRAQALDMAAKRFDRADTNKDGVLTAEEFATSRDRHSPPPGHRHGLRHDHGGPQSGEHKGPPPGK